MSENAFLYVIKPVEISDQQLEWSGALNALKSTIIKNQRKIEEHYKVSAEERVEMNVKMDAIQKKIDTIQGMQGKMDAI